ncbi:hypothetical protein Arub01_00420 [Actinomadura rubrobrunea]|uniref:M48 family metalloprotease n=2 Tax=Actinomadura rubrobrunea TaxID=115335 RepID=A0A9W6PRL7_9ACTN|nr:hypothetical protein Arub01_00420 [Actinomadura rubrobrunea]
MSAPPGWYPDPQWMGRERYWDGQGWTDQSRPWTGKAKAMTEHVTVPARRLPSRKALARGRPDRSPQRTATAPSRTPHQPTPAAPAAPHRTWWPTTVTVLAALSLLASELAIVGPLAYVAHRAWPVWGAAVPFAAWCALALLTFLPPARNLAARACGCRPATGPERARLDWTWRQVVRRAGLRSYPLMVADSEELNACTPVPGIVAVTTHSAGSLSTAHLQAVLAHELGHKRGPQALPAFVTAHLAVPSRALRWTLRALWSPIVPLWKRAVAWHRPIGFLMVFLLAAVATAVTVAAALPAAAAYAAAALTRLAAPHLEAQADAFAARLGLGPDLLAAIEDHIESRHQASGSLPLPLVQRAHHLRRVLA